MITTVLSRDARLIRRARKHLSRAAQLWAKHRAEIGEPLAALAAHWAHAAQFHLVEADYEAFVGIAFPSGLDFDARRPKVLAKSLREFTAWLKRKNAAGARVDARYRAIYRGKSAHWAIAAAARMGQIPSDLAAGLYRAPVPRAARTGPNAAERYDDYCERLERKARPFENRSVAAFQTCLAETTKRNWFNRWARLCERELGAASPESYPPTRETRAEVASVAPVVDTSPVIGVLVP